MADAKSSDQQLQAAARARIAQGLLPLAAAERTWGGPGSGALCALCDRAVTSPEIEFELEFAAPTGSLALHFHLRCHAVWDAVRRPHLDTWITIARALPLPGMRVEVRVRLSEARTIILDLRRERVEGLADPVWINATSGERLPSSWSALEWRPRVADPVSPTEEAQPLDASRHA